MNAEADTKNLADFKVADLALADWGRKEIAIAAIAAAGTPVFAYKGETLAEYWEFTHRIFAWADGGTPNMILNDGGDATLLVHLGTRAESDRSAISHPG